MKEYKKLWKKDKWFYLFVVFVLSLYALFYFGKTAKQEYGYLKTMAEVQITGYRQVEKNLDYYIEKGVIASEQDFYEKYAVEIDNERLVKVESWGIDVFNWSSHVLYRNLLVALLVIQTLRFYLQDGRREREFMLTLPVRQRTVIVYEWASGGLLITIPMLCALLPVSIYSILTRQYAKENHCWFMLSSDWDYNSFSPLMVLSGWVAVLFFYAAFLLMRYLTNSLAANYLAAIVILGIPMALVCILESCSVFYDWNSSLMDAVFFEASHALNEIPFSFLPSNTIQLIAQALFGVLFIVIAIVFTEKCKREYSGMFAHKTIKVLFLTAVYIWCFLFFLNSVENISLTAMAFISFLGSGLVMVLVSYLVRDR